MNDLYILVEDDSTYNFMINTMFSDAINAYNMQVCVEKKSNNLMINLLKNRKFKRITKGCFDSLLEKRYILRKQILDISNSYNQVYFIFLNSSFLESRYPASVLKKYKAISNKFIFVLLYIDIISHPCSRHANYLRSTGIFDYIYTVDKNDARYNGLIN